MKITTFEIITNRAMTYVFAIGCCALTWLLFVNLDAAKFEVIQAIKAETGELKTAHAGLKSQIETMQVEIDQRVEWMKAVDTELAKRTLNQIYRSEFVQWSEEAKQLNPALVIPDLKEIPPEELLE